MIDFAHMMDPSEQRTKTLNVDPELTRRGLLVGIAGLVAAMQWPHPYGVERPPLDLVRSFVDVRAAGQHTPTGVMVADAAEQVRLTRVVALLGSPAERAQAQRRAARFAE